MELKERLDLAAKLLVTEDEEALACAQKALEGQRFAEQNTARRYESMRELLYEVFSLDGFLGSAIDAIRQLRQKYRLPVLPALRIEVPEVEEWSEEDFAEYMQIIKENREKPGKEYDF